MPVADTSETNHDRQHPNVTFGVLAIGALAYVLLQSMVLPALPTIERALHTTQTTVTWVLTAYLISASIATPVLGRLGDMFGKGRMLVIVFGALALGSLIAATTNNIHVLIVARIIQGFGGAVFPLAFGIIRDEFPRERVAGAVGGISAILGIGGGLAIVLAGPIVDHLSYHWLFWIPLGMSLVAMTCTLLFVPESPVRSPGRVNVLAAFLMSGWLVALLVGVSEGTRWGWSSARELGMLAAAVVLFATWIRVELRASEPLVDMRMMRVPAVWWTNVSALLFGFGMFAMMVVLPAFVQVPKAAGYGLGMSATGSGLTLLPPTVSMLIVGLVIGRITAAVGSKVPLVCGGLMSGMAFLFLAFAHTAIWQVFLTTSIVGFGIGFAFSAMTNLVVEAVEPSQTGVATGMNANIRTIGGAAGSQVVAAILASGVAAAGLPHERSYAITFFVMSGVMFAAGLAAALIPAARLRRQLVTAAHDDHTLAADAALLSASLDAGETLAEHH